MVNRTDNAAKREKRTNSQHTGSASPARSLNDKLQNDEFLVALSDAYENKRAQQVSEWQSLQPKVMRQAA
jgi:hypothetical protein